MGRNTASSYRFFNMVKFFNHTATNDEQLLICINNIQFDNSKNYDFIDEILLFEKFTFQTFEISLCSSDCIASGIICTT